MQQLFPTVVYILCFLTSSACFVLLAGNNLLLVLDLLVLPDVNLRIGRLLLALAAVAVLLFGFVWDLEED